MQWLKEHFISRKQTGKVVLLLDGHASHCTDPDILELAQVNGIIMVCLPPHSTNYLQPLDRCFTKTLFLQVNARLSTISPRSQSVESTVRTVAEGGMAEICHPS
jgi:hypothetical protein